MKNWFIPGRYKMIPLSDITIVKLAPKQQARNEFEPSDLDSRALIIFGTYTNTSTGQDVYITIPYRMAQIVFSYFKTFDGLEWSIDRGFYRT